MFKRRSSFLYNRRCVVRKCLVKSEVVPVEKNIQNPRCKTLVELEMGGR